MKITRNCVVCGQEATPLGKSYSSAFLGKCQNCQMVFSTVIPDEFELKLHYSNYDRNAEVSNLTFQVYDSWFEKWKKMSFKSLLDFGCGLGALVDYANLNGFSSVGTEIDLDVVGKLSSKGVKVIDFDSLVGNSDKYNLISIIEVLEHVSDPKMVLIQLKQKLTSPGMMFITTPNFNALNRRILKGKWRALWYPDHINIFSYASLKKLLEDCGYQIVSIETSGHILFDRIYSGENSRKASSILTIENQRKFFMKNAFTIRFKQFLNFVLNQLKLGDTLIVYASKS